MPIIERTLDIIKSENVGRILGFAFGILGAFSIERFSSTTKYVFAAFIVFIFANFVNLIISFISRPPISNKRYKRLSVVGVILKKQSEWRNIQFSLLGVVAVFYIVGSYAAGCKINASVLLFVLSLYGLLYFRLYLLEQRVRSGTYGTTEEDAREIISFILRDPSLMGGDDDQGRPIITARDMREMAKAAVEDVTRPVAC